MAFPTGWRVRCAVTIAVANIPGALTNYPMLVTEAMLPASMFDSDGPAPAQSGGGDIRFTTDEAGATRLPCEIVQFVTDPNPANGKARVFVKVPAVSASVDTAIWVWYNTGAAEVQPAVTDTYGRNAVWSDYALVSHDLLTDSTGAGSLTNSGTSSTTGPFGFTSADFDGGTDKVTASLTAHAAQRTFQWSSYLDGTQPTLGRLFDKRTAGGSANAEIVYYDQGTTNTWIYERYFSTTAGRWRPTGTPSTTTWESWALTYNSGSTANDPIWYKNGSAAPSTEIQAPSGTLTSNSDAYVLGNRGSDNARQIDGKLALFRLRDSILSANWLAAEYVNYNAPGTFASAGVPKYSLAPDSASHGHSASSPTIVTPLTPNNAAHGHAASSPTFSTNAPHDAYHDHQASSPTVSWKGGISPTSAAHGHAASSPTITVRYTISPASAAHGHFASSPRVARTLTTPLGRILVLDNSFAAERVLALPGSLAAGRILPL